MQANNTHPKDRSFLARYGAAILSGGVASIPTALYRYQRDLRLTPQLVWFISAILAHKWDADLPYPSLRRMAEETGVSQQMLHTYKKKLVEDGLLIIVNRQTDLGGKDTNYYDFNPLMARLEELLRRDKGESSPAEHHLNQGGDTHLNPSVDTHLNQGVALIEESVYEEALKKNQLKTFEFEANTRKIFQGRVGEPEPEAPPQEHTTPSGLTRIGKLFRPPDQVAAPHATSLPVSYPIPQGRGEKTPGRRPARLPEMGKKPPTPSRVEQSTSSTPNAPLLATHEPQDSPPPASTDLADLTPDELAALTYTVEQISEKLGDARHARSNVTQARRILASSGLNQNAWTGMLWSVYHRTAEQKQKGRLKKPAAWFFTALREDVEQRTTRGTSLVSSLTGDRPRKSLAGRYAHLVHR